MHLRRLIALFFVGSLLFSSESQSQSAPTPKKTPTPEQQRFQDQFAKWRSEREVLRVKATAALKAALERASADNCRNAGTNLDLRICLDKELQAVQEKFAAFTSSLRAMLALAQPEFPGEKRLPGPSGMALTSAELAAEFDRLEAQSTKYREIAARAAFHQWGGGSGAPAGELSARLQLLQTHMQELSFIYDSELSER